MSNETEPIVMEVSPFSNIGHKLTFLASILQSKEQAESECVYIECFTKIINDSVENIIRLRTNNGIWTELNPYDKVNGKIFDKGIAVNLYDLNNVIEQCNDELISFWIDEETNELVINSFYNEIKDIDELEVRLKLLVYENIIPCLTDIGTAELETNVPLKKEEYPNI